MKQKKEITRMITPKEGAYLSIHSTESDLDYCYDLYHEFLDRNPCKLNSLYYTLRVFACMYNAGRIQGIREERAKKKKSPVILPDAQGDKPTHKNYNI